VSHNPEPPLAPITRDSRSSTNQHLSAAPANSQAPNNSSGSRSTAYVHVCSCAVLTPCLGLLPAGGGSELRYTCAAPRIPRPESQLWLIVVIFWSGPCNKTGLRRAREGSEEREREGEWESGRVGEWEYSATAKRRR